MANLVKEQEIIVIDIVSENSISASTNLTMQDGSANKWFAFGTAEEISQFIKEISSGVLGILPATYKLEFRFYDEQKDEFFPLTDKELIPGPLKVVGGIGN